MTPQPSNNLLTVRDLNVTFNGARTVQAVHGVNLTLAAGETLGLLGESGSGKSVTLRTLLRINPPQRTAVSGSITVDGQDVLALQGGARWCPWCSRCQGWRLPRSTPSASK